MELFDNVTRIVRDDLTETIKPHSRLSIAAACFSIYAYKELKKQLSSIDECRFIFTSPTFVADKSEKEQKEFYIPRLSRERSLYGTEFEVKLRNELNQRAIARECADWIRRKATFKSNNTQEAMQGFLNVDQGDQVLTYMPLNGFTTVDIGCDRGKNVYNMVNKFDAPFSTEYMKLFERVWSDDTRMQDVTEEVIDSISAVYQENPPELVYFLTLYQIFHEFLADLSEDDLPKEKTGFRDSVIWKKLYAFQKDAALGIINKLEKYNGCILADSVGLGKTFTSLAVIKYYECRNGRVLVLCPKKLKDNWLTYRGNLKNNPLEKDRMRYDVVFHTDLSRDRGETVTGMKIEQISWDNYDLVVIDESHNFRNGGEYSGEDNEKENRYLRLMNRIIKGGMPTKVLMLSATPVNNRFNDLRNQLALAYEGQPEQINQKLNTTKDIDTIFREAQKAFNAWSKLPPEERTTAALQQELQEFGIHSDLITGTIDGRTTIPRFPVDMNSILTCFSPISKDRELVLSDLKHHNIDILIATDCISEGQNLQDCDYCINYDIHWNPVRIIQRFGRVDRIGSKNQYIQLVNFWPDIELDEYIKLKARVETRMRISVMTSTGDDDYLNTSENGDLTYRRQQLQRLKEEVVDLEEMNSGISIMDLGLNDFRMDLLAYIKENPGIDKTPFGIHAVVHGDKPGVIFVLKNVNKGIDIKNQNYLHPFYMVYVGDDGEIICNHLQPKDTLDRMRHASRGRNVPDLKACHVFNAETKDGRDMRRVSQLLQDAIASIISKKEESDIDSFFGGGQTSFLSGNVSGLDDFELICFMVVVS